LEKAGIPTVQITAAASLRWPAQHTVLGNIVHVVGDAGFRRDKEKK
jgi:hypothetical protein